MATLGAPGTGFSSRDPSRAVETVAGIIARKSSRRSGGGMSIAQPGSSEYKTFEAARVKAAFEAKEKAKKIAEKKKVAQEKARVVAKKLAATRTQQALREKTQLEQMRQAGQERITKQRERAEVEQRRIRQERVDILREGGQKRVQEFTQKETGRKVEHTITSIKGRRIFEVKDLETGKTTIKTYAPPKGGGRVIQTGGIILNGDIEPTPEEGIITASKDIFFKDKPDRTNQVYDPKTGMYVASAYGLGAGGTALYSAPTMEESIKIKEAEYKGSFTGLVETGKKELKWYEEKVVIPISESKYFKTYKEKVVAPLSEKVIQPTKKVIIKGLDLYKEKVVVPIRKTIPSLGETQVGKIAEAKRYIQRVSPETEITIGLPGQRRKVKAGEYKDMGLFEFSKKVYLGEVETAFTDIAKKSKLEKPEYYGKGARLTSEFGAYVLPGYFVGEVGIQAGEAALGGKFGGEKSTLEFVKKKPIEVALVGGLGVLKAVRYLRTPVVATKPLPLKKPEAFDVQKIVKVDGKPTTVGVYEIRGEVRPTTIITETTRGRQIVDYFGRQTEKIVRVGGEPVVSMRALPKVKVIPAKPFTVRTPSAVVGEQPFLVSEAIAGKKYVTISRLEGVSKRISLKEFNQLTKQEQYLLQRRAMQITGREVPLSQVPTILDKEAVRQTALIKSQRLVRVTPRKRTTEIKLVPGKRRPVLSLAVSEAEKAVKVKAGELTKVKTLFRDVTFERKILKGKPTELDTVILKLKPKLEPEDAIKFIKPAKIKKTPYLTTIQEKVTPISAIPLPKPEIVKPSIKIISPKPIPSERVLPVSAYVGTGQYELTDVAPTYLGVMQPSMINGVKPDIKKDIILDVKPKVITKMRMIEVQKDITKIKVISRVRPVQEIIPKTKVVTDVVSKQIQITKQIQRPITETLLRQIQRPITKPIVKPIIEPKIIIPPVIPSLARRILERVEKEPTGFFESIGFRFGKEVKLGKAKTKKVAAKKLEKFMSKTLGASGFITKDKKKIKAVETGLLKLPSFRKSKISKFLIVERKEKRLKKTAPEETKEIQYFRKVKKGKKKKKSLFG